MVNDLFNDGRVVEVGCGEGLLLEAVNQPQDKSYFLGLDRDSGMMERARIRLMGNNSSFSLLRGRGNMLPLQSESIDIVICINTFYNQPSFEDVVEILEEMVRVCRKGGYIIFDIRNTFNLFIYLAYRYVRLYDPTCKSLPLHTHSFLEVDNILKRLGVRIVKRMGVFPPLWFLAPAIVFAAQKSKA
jgi:ubiquinone/menaquinone biosynthesis C-methylase UbiE